MRCLRAVILSGLLAWAGGADAADFGMGEELPYRLAGTLSTGDAAMAMIEMPGGKYRTVRIGDTFEDGIVEKITDEQVIIAVSAGKQWVLRLSGGLVEPLAIADETALYETTLTRFTDFGALQRKIDRAQSKHGSGQPLELGAALRAALGLPKQARVLAVDQTPIRSPEQLAKVLADILEKEHGVLVSVGGVKGIEQVYLSPTGDPTPVPASLE